ncbi:alpha-acetolactate decarboxylase [Desulfarculus baarsii DSM 2075]|uniref:Alpha-acetolactate decarboxylase n=1 Tax=Desulfarculus baarsii (strain ATCC 33931 / DSM 2075 / LMG 7858 / VKM B-1802 / 2st14) TaxID=644282 RepID=E1QDT3_DESB2|nr:acetolactate decarboxylase [Desulfarculus baarsii]ADK83719.1 alpha-acetolactate decarboxylase [Desulfarculus baarsii DSM 2075]
MKNFPRLCALATLILLLAAAGARAQEQTLYQYSTLDALLEGVYDGQLTMAELLGHGDLGLGTFNGLDGEMVVIDGKAYQAPFSGKVELMPASARTPFAQVTAFAPEKAFEVKGPMDMAGLQAAIDKAIESPNLFYAIRVSGGFKHVTARSVPRQTRPYPRLVEVVKKQAVFQFDDVQGDIVGFLSPAYVKGLGAPGYHLHFLRADRQAGGHLLAVEIENATVQIDAIPGLRVQLPTSGDFLNVGLGDDKSADLHEVETKK